MLIPLRTDNLTAWYPNSPFAVQTKFNGNCKPFPLSSSADSPLSRLSSTKFSGVYADLLKIMSYSFEDQKKVWIQQVYNGHLSPLRDIFRESVPSCNPRCFHPFEKSDTASLRFWRRLHQQPTESMIQTVLSLFAEAFLL